MTECSHEIEFEPSATDVMDGTCGYCGNTENPDKVVYVPRPDDALRICSAHREITEFHMVCQADAQLAAQKLAAYTGYSPSEWAALNLAAAEAEARLQLSAHYLSILARAYGVEEDG